MFGYAVTKRLPLLAILTALLFGMVQEGYGQTRTFLTGQKTGNRSFGLLSDASLTSPMVEHSVIIGGFQFYFGSSSILNGNTTEYTEASANQALGVLGLIPAASTYIQFRNTNNSTIPAGTTSYITLMEPPVIGGIANLSLGEQTFITGSGYVGATNYSISGFGSENNGTSVGGYSELLVDAANDWYLGVTPTSAYNSVRLNVTLPEDEISIARNISVQVHNAFTQTSGGACSVFGKFTTPGEVTGISVNLLNLSEAISDAHHVLLDNDEYAAYSSGILGVGVANSISQTIVYDHKASSTDGLNVKLALSNNLIGLDVLNAEAISISAYDGPGGNAVWEKDLIEIAQLLDLDLLNLINLGGTHGVLEFTVHPNKQFDRIQIQFTPSVINVGVLNDALRVYHVKLAPAPPTITDQPEDQEICAGETVTFSVSANSPAGTITGYQWQYYDGTNWVPAPGTYENASYTISNTDQSLNGRLYRVAITGGHFGCEQTIYSESAELSVTPLPGRATVNFLETNN